MPRCCDSRHGAPLIPPSSNLSPDQVLQVEYSIIIISIVIIIIVISNVISIVIINISISIISIVISNVISNVIINVISIIIVIIILVIFITLPSAGPKPQLDGSLARPTKRPDLPKPQVFYSPTHNLLEVDNISAIAAIISPLTIYVASCRFHKPFLHSND